MLGLLIIFVTTCVFDVHDRLVHWMRMRQKYHLRVPKPVLGLTAIVFIVNALMSTALLLPVCTTLLDLFACKYVDRPGEGTVLEWAFAPGRDCYRGIHLQQVLLCMGFFLVFMPFAARLAYVRGDSAELTPLHPRNTLQRIKKRLFGRWRDNSVGRASFDCGLMTCRSISAVGRSQLLTVVIKVGKEARRGADAEEKFYKHCNNVLLTLFSSPRSCWC